MMQPVRRRMSDVSVGDIMKERTQRIGDFLDTRRLADLSAAPTTLADIFEFMAAFDDSPQLDT